MAAVDDRRSHSSGNPALDAGDPSACRNEAAILRALVDGDDGVSFFAVDPGFRYTCFNTLHAELMRSWYCCEIALGRCFLDDLNVAEDRAAACAVLERALRGERVFETVASSDPGGERRLFEITHDPVRDADGEVVGVAVRTRDVTELHRMSEQLRILDRAVESSINAIAIADLDGLLTHVNPAFLALWGYDDEGEVVGRPVVDFWESQRDAAEIRATMLATGGWTGELTARGRDGGAFVVHLTTSLVVDEAGAPIGAMAAFLDVTERTRAEAELRRSNERLALAQRAAGAGIWDWDMPTGTLNWTPEFYRLFGLPSDAEATFDTWRAALHPDDLEAAEARITDAVERRVALASEYRVLRPDGGEVWIEALGDTTYDEAGRPVRMSGICFDVTARKSAQAAFAESEQKWRRVLEHTPQIGVSLDQAGRIVFANRHLLQLTGWDEDEVLGRDWFDLFIPEERRPEIRGVLAADMDEPGATGFSTFENEILTKGGEWRSIAWSNVVTKDADGVVVDVTSLGVDVTERRRADEEIRRLNVELERRVQDRTARLIAANQELEAFSYSISHDLREPLRAIDGFSQILLEDKAPALGDDGRESLERVRAAAQKMGRLIDDLLSLSRLGRRETNSTEVDLGELVAEVVGRLRREDPDRRVEVAVASGCTVRTDAGLVEALLANLIGNAWKFTGKRAEAHIEFSETLLDGERVFFVGDDGAGFDPAYADKLFQPFQRLHGPEEYPGTGIGLATVGRIVSRLGGRCWADGAVGEGATFFFTLGEPAG